MQSPATVTCNQLKSVCSMLAGRSQGYHQVFNRANTWFCQAYCLFGQLIGPRSVEAGQLLRDADDSAGTGFDKGVLGVP
jgi:hypothetical protein